jgi:membrane-associated phospholipid phosphatase
VKKYITICITVFLLFPSFSSAQTWDQFSDDFNGSLDLGIDLTKSMFSSKNIPYYLGGAALIAGSMFLIDEPLRDYSQDHQNAFKSGLFGIDKYYGDIKYTPAAVLALYTVGLFSKNQSVREAGLRASQAMVYTGIITVITKEIFGRSRPYSGDGSTSFHPFTFQEDHRSFFSGHTSLVFSISTVFAAEIDNIFWKIGWYGLAVLVGGARIYHDKHWFSDVITGAVVGYAIGRFVVNNSDKYINTVGADTQGGAYQINFNFYLN